MHTEIQTLIHTFGQARAWLSSRDKDAPHYATMTRMKVVILYRPNSEHRALVDTFVHDYQVRHGSKNMELIDIDQRDGAATAALYDITNYPAILVIANDGTPLQMWQGTTLPLIDEVASYTLEH
jgi:hypothetical protein